MSDELRYAGISSVNKADIQEWLTIDTNEPRHTVLTKEEIVETLSRPGHDDDEEDDEDIPDEPAIPSHSEAYVCLSTSICWLESQ